MSRDLLYKPQVPVMNPEESEVKPGPKPADKAGAKVPRGRDLGGVGTSTPAGQAPVAKEAQAPGRPGGPAFKAAYFNQDTSGVSQVNLRQKNMQALRGGEGASDLKKIVLPPAIGIDTPDPGQLRGASDLMGLDGSMQLNLESMLGRQGAWTKGKGVTAEMIKARQEQLEQMVRDRKNALKRLGKRKGKKAAASLTIERAVGKDGAALEQTEDVVAEGGELVRGTAAQAEGMHKRIAKMLGIKRQQ